MAIFSSISGFFKRNKRKIIIASTISVSLYYLVDFFIVKKFRNFQDSLKQELFIKEQIKRRFIQTQNDCYYTLLALLPVLVSPIIDNSPTELITKALKLKKSSNSTTTSKEISDSLLTTDNLILHSNSSEGDNLSLYMSKSKTELWRLLKIKTITRFLTLSYASSSLLLLTRLQLNILARKSYLQSAISMTNGNKIENLESQSTNENYIIEQSYLSLSWWLLNKGWEALNFEIEKAVEEKFKSINARTELTINDFIKLLIDSVESINSNKVKILNSIWPNFDDLNLTLLNTNPSLINDYNDDFLKLINETNLIIENEVFFNNLSSMVYSNLSTLNDNLTETSNSDPTSSKLKLANLLALLSTQCETLCNNNDGVNTFPNNDNEFNDHELTGNDYINNSNNLESLDDFSASIYSNIE